MERFTDRIAYARGWTRRAIAVAVGSCGALILAPVNLGVALIVPMSVAVWLLDGASASPTRSYRAAFADGWWLGFGYHLAGFWWLGAAFLLDPQFVILLPLGVIGVPAVLAVFTGGGFLLARVLWRRDALRVLALAAGLAATEWARGHWFTGFPWNTFGMALGGALVPAQMAALIGSEGLTIVAVAIAAAPATLVDRSDRRWLPTAAACVAIAGIVAYGLVRLSSPPPPPVPGVTIRIVQPGLRPDEAFTYENKDAIVDTYLRLSRSYDAEKHIALADVTELVWPESPFPFILTREAAQMAKIAALLPPRTTLVTGAAREIDNPSEGGQPAHSDYYNAVLAVGHGGHVLAAYDKVHLVPFGEYLPFDGLLRRLGLHNFVTVPGGFTPGSGHQLLEVTGLPPAAPLICYEAIFPDEVAAATKGRPGYLLNITNDGWFGTTTGPWQHLAQARLRSIEQGLPMVRGAATGISAMIDAYGRIDASITLGQSGILDAALPGMISQPIYTRLPCIAAMSIIFTILILGTLRFKNAQLP